MKKMEVKERKSIENKHPMIVNNPDLNKPNKGLGMAV